MNTIRSALLVGMVVGFGCGHSPGVEPPSAATGSTPTVVVDPEVVATVEANLDPSVDPCVDFYRFACGSWLARTEIPSDAPLASRSMEHVEAVMEELRTLVAEPPGDGREDSVLHRYYQACMNEPAIEAAAPAAIETLVQLVGEPSDPQASARVLARLSQIGAPALMEPFVFAGPEQPDHAALYLSQAGLGLDSPDAYARGEGDELLTAYASLVEQTLASASEPEPRAQARRVVAFERRLARAFASAAELREPAATESVAVADLATLAPGIDWATFFDALGRSDLPQVVLMPRSYFAALDEILGDASAATWRAYLRWTALRTYAHALTAELRDAHFAFFRGLVRGQAEPPPRWSICVDQAFAAMPQRVDRRWVARYFPAGSMHTARDLAARVHAALVGGLETSTWLDTPTRTAALAKARAIERKIGYPEARPDAAAPVVTDEFFANLLEARRRSTGQELARAGRPIDPDQWPVTAVTVNGFYDPMANEILFPAGFLRSPHFDPRWPMAMNFGALGVVMGHELTHGFDDRGRRRDAKGEDRDWWSEASAQRYEQRAACVAEQYARFEIAPGQALDGRLVLGEAIADLGGIKFSLAAYAQWAEEHGVDPQTPVGDHLDDRQLLFVAYAQQMCEKVSAPMEQARAARSPHPPARFRVNGTVAHTPAFWSAFACEPGDAMRPAKSCEVW
ncbi:MAG: M13 family metallopeptidase [Myxococcota bacterium]